MATRLIRRRTNTTKAKVSSCRPTKRLCKTLLNSQGWDSKSSPHNKAFTVYRTKPGAAQQAQQQQIINQAMQDYANAQQYPLMQLGTMSNMYARLAYASVYH